MTALLGIDIGTTRVKAGLFSQDGALLRLASLPTPAERSTEGYSFYDPEKLWSTAVEVIRSVQEEVGSGEVGAVGIAGMAETGLLVDASTGAPRTPFIPWFDPSSSGQVEKFNQGDPRQRFLHAGLRPTFKSSLAKILWLQERDPGLIPGARWLSVEDYIAYRLTGVMGTDYSLAGRTFAFRIDRRAWDEEWLARFGLDASLFPAALPSGAPLGGVTAQGSCLSGLPPGAPVAISGHDHICAAFAAGAVQPGLVFDSMGTAETLIGSLGKAGPGESEYHSGLVVGCHVARGQYYWMGGLSASGGSIEWIRSILNDPALSYEDVEALLSQAPSEPTGILYFPYLSGSGSPHTEACARAAIIGLRASHGRADLLKAVMEGAAYEVEFIRRAAERAAGHPVTHLRAAGGGTRSRGWIQIKADVSGCTFEILPMPQATLLGAALIAGAGCGVYTGEAEALLAGAPPSFETITPDPGRHALYKELYEQGFEKLQEPLRHYYRTSPDATGSQHS